MDNIKLKIILKLNNIKLGIILRFKNKLNNIK